MHVQIFHNPRCSKSRQALALLQESSHQVEIIEYLKNPLSLSELKQVQSKLQLRPKEFLRHQETVWKELSLDAENDEAVLGAMAEHPILIERPIVVVGETAVVGRPPERVLELL